MQELKFSTFLAVFEEMFGRGLFWMMVAVAVAITLAYVFVLIRDRSMSMRKFLLAQLSMPIGGVAAVAYVLTMTRSTLGHMGGPIDLIIMLGVFAAGAVGFAILVYVVQSLIRGKAASNA
jgi:hypothetical protein